MKTDVVHVLYQDHHTLIINKPAGVVMHPTYKHTDGDTLRDALLAYLEQQGKDDWQPPDLPDEPSWTRAPQAVQQMLRERRAERIQQEWGLLPRPCLLHRLDKDTSGVVALARTELSCRYLVRQFYEHSILKRYLAVVAPGAPEWARPRVPLLVKRRERNGDEVLVGHVHPLSSLGDDALIIDGPLQRDPEERRRCIVGADGQEAQTLIRVLVAREGLSLLAVEPITGRTHQIRAHLAALGYGIVGDNVYAPQESNTIHATLARQFLHASRLELRLFPNGQQCAFVAPLANDLVTWLERFFPEGLPVLKTIEVV